MAGKENEIVKEADEGKFVCSLTSSMYFLICSLSITEGTDHFSGVG